MDYDVIIVGGGPAGLAAALTLGRARKRVLLCDAGSPRNSAAALIQGFVTRDGTPPHEFRRIAREQLAAYPGVQLRAEQVAHIRGEIGAFEVDFASESATARRVILAMGMVDEIPDTPGYRDLWGRAIFQCPYCHGWEHQGSRLGMLVPAPELLDGALLLRGWSDDVLVFTDAGFAVPEDARTRLASAGIALEERRISRFLPGDDGLAAVQLCDGARIARDVVFARPPQRQTDLVSALGLELDAQGFVQLNEQKQTSREGVYAAGDLTTFLQVVSVAVAAGVHAAAMLNHELTLELVQGG